MIFGWVDKKSTQNKAPICKSWAKDGQLLDKYLQKPYTRLSNSLINLTDLPSKPKPTKSTKRQKIRPGNRPVDQKSTAPKIFKLGTQSKSATRRIQRYKWPSRIPRKCDTKSGRSSNFSKSGDDTWWIGCIRFGLGHVAHGDWGTHLTDCRASVRDSSFHPIGEWRVSKRVRRNAFPSTPESFASIYV